MTVVWGNIPASVWTDSDGTKLNRDRQETGQVSKPGLS